MFLTPSFLSLFLGGGARKTTTKNKDFLSLPNLECLVRKGKCSKKGNPRKGKRNSKKQGKEGQSGTKNQNKGTEKGATVPKSGTRVHSPNPPFCLLSISEDCPPFLDHYVINSRRSCNVLRDVESIKRGAIAPFWGQVLSSQSLRSLN